MKIKFGCIKVGDVSFSIGFHSPPYKGIKKRLSLDRTKYLSYPFFG